MKNILAPVDLSAVTEQVLSTAAELAKALNAKLWLVHVAAPDPDFVGFQVGPHYVREGRAEVLRQEHQDLQEMANRVRNAGIEAEALLVQGPTTSTILEEVARLNADLVVMGSHGRGGLYKAFVGSVSEQVLAAARVPVLVVPARQQGV